MGYKYELIIAPGELVSNAGAIRLGNFVEVAIFSHYLLVTGAPFKPGGDQTLVDYFDTGVPQDYVKLMVQRHAPYIDEKELRADARIKDALGIPDISTYEGRFVPPRMLAAGTDRIEDKNRNEYYEIKPNSDSGESAGVLKLKKIVAGNIRYGLRTVYKPGTLYPSASPTYIPLKWSEAFEYLRLVFMWENNLKTCDIDLQVIQLPKVPGLILYAIRIRLELDIKLALDKLRALAAGVAVALAAVAVANILELAADLIGVEVAASLLEALEKLLEPATGQEELPKFRIAPQPPTGPRVETPPLESAPQLPEVELEPEEFDADDEQFPKLKKAIAAVVLGGAYALPGKKLDVFCDEDYYLNVIFDDSQVRRFVAMTRLALPLSPTITVASAYLRMAIPGWRSIELLLEQIDKRFPNQSALRLEKRIPEVLRSLARSPGGQVTIVSQVLIQTPAIAAFIDPTLRENARKYASPAVPHRRIALPPELLARWKGRDGSTGAAITPPTMDELVNSLLAGNPDARNRKYLKDALGKPGFLLHALRAAPGFTLGIGIHALYQLPDGPVTEQNRYGELKAVNVSRMFAVNAADGASPPAKPYQLVKAGKSADALIENGDQPCRYIGRMRVSPK